MTKTMNRSIPIKKLWSFWEGPMDDIIETSIRTWHTHLPDWTITVLDMQAIKDYDLKLPSSFDMLHVTAKSDLIRLNLLYLYGGAWIDASVVLNTNLDWLAKYTHIPLFAYTNKLGFEYVPYVENWFLYAYRKHEVVIRKWLDMFVDILEEYPHHKNHVAYSNVCTSRPDYFICYQAFFYLKSIDAHFDELVTSIPKVRPTFYTPLVASQTSAPMVKYTNANRHTVQRYFFPMIYLYLIIVLICLVGSIMMVILLRNRH